MGTKRIQFFGILILFTASLCLAEVGDMTLTNNLCLKPGKEIRLFYGTQDYQYLEIFPYYWNEEKWTLKIPCLGYGAGNFLTTDENGALVFLSTAPYYGDITSVWTDDNGDVSALIAASDDTLNASLAGSTIPWKVSTTANPTTEGMVVWDSDDDRLAIGDGASTYYIQLDGNLTIESASIVNQDLTTDASVTFNDITVSTPSNIYDLEHDSFSGVDANEHIDWQNAPNDLSTTGTGTFENVHISSGETYDTILEAYNIYNTADRTITIGLEDKDRYLGIYGDEIILYYGVPQSIAVTASPKFSGLNFDFSTQDYLITDRSEAYLAIQGQTSDASVAVDIFNKDGDGAADEGVYLNLFGKGTPSDITNREVLTLAYSNVADAQRANIYTSAAGTGTLRSLALYTGANTSQFILGTDGNNSMGGDLDVTGSTTTGGLTLNYSGQDFLFTSRANAILAVQGQASGQAAGFEFYTGDGDGTDDISIDLFAMGSPSDLTDMERLKVGFDQSESYWQIYSGESGDNTIYPIHLWTEGHASQLVLGNDGHNSMSGNLAVTGTVSGATGSSFGNLTLANGSITDSGGAISFNDENLSTSGDISAAKFAGSGDADTYMAMSDDVFSMAAGGVAFATLQELFIGQDVFVVNTNQADVDFKVNASGAENLLLCDAENARVGINDGSPAEALDVTGNVNVTGVYKVGDDDGVSGTLVLDDGTTEKITLVFTGGILTSRTVEATTGSALADWTD